MEIRRTLTVAVTVSALLTTACGGKSSSAGAGSTSSGPAPATSEKAAAATIGSAAGAAIKVGFITKFPVDFYSTMVNAVKTWQKSHTNVTVLFAQGKSGTDDQSEIAAIQSFVSQGVKAIAITPTSPNVKGELQKAVDKGIKVVLIDNDIPGWAGKSALVATDNLAGGKLAGTFIKGKVAAGAKIAILEGVLGNPSLADRVTGMLGSLGSGYQVVDQLPTDCDQTKGLSAAQDILTAHPDVAVIYGACGPPILGALQALKSASKSKVVVVGFDADPGQAAAILAGQEAGSVAQFPAKMGSLGVQTAVDAAEGKAVSANVDTGTAVVTAVNAAQFK
ncbi:MAG: ribose transport system substrate-binding protein [Frankiales bacterium]|nr:ribose transport system substrate-binding protein [Frankiales bacterium]